MSYEDAVSTLVRVIEAVGALIMVIGGVGVAVRYGRDVARADRRPEAYRAVRRRLGQVILAGLEVLIIADIIRTIVVETTLTSVAVLGLVVCIRIVLSFSLEVEMDGMWPWQRWRVSSSDRAGPA